MPGDSRVYRLTTTHRTFGLEHQNTFYYQSDDPNTGETEEDECVGLIEQFLALVYPPWLQCLSNQTELAFLSCKHIWPTDGYGTTRPVVDEVGTVIEPSQPLGSTMLISFRSVAPGRHFKRRVYLSGQPENFTSVNNFVSWAIARANELGLAIRSTEVPLLTGDEPVFFPVAYSKQLAAELGPDPFSRLAGHVVCPVTTSQRARNIRVTG